MWKMACGHDVIGSHKFDLSKKPKEANAEKSQEIQINLMVMGGGKFEENNVDAEEFLIKRLAILSSGFSASYKKSIVGTTQELQH